MANYRTTITDRTYGGVHEHWWSVDEVGEGFVSEGRSPSLVEAAQAAEAVIDAHEATKDEQRMLAHEARMAEVACSIKPMVGGGVRVEPENGMATIKLPSPVKVGDSFTWSITFTYSEDGELVSARCVDHELGESA